MLGIIISTIQVQLSVAGEICKATGVGTTVEPSVIVTFSHLL